MRQKFPPHVPDRFREFVEAIYPDSPASRLGRVARVTTRTAQRWIAGEAPAPDDVREHVTRTYRTLERIKPTPEQALDVLIHNFLNDETPLDREVLGAALSVAYAKLLARPIE